MELKNHRNVTSTQINFRKKHLHVTLGKENIGIPNDRHSVAGIVKS